MKEEKKKEISGLAKQIIEKLSIKNYKISFAESVTGGLLVSSLTKEKNASKIFEIGYVVYSNEAKESVLGVKKDVINSFSVYSKETVLEMLKGLKRLTTAEILVSVSGIAGPDSLAGKEVGETFIGISIKDKVFDFHKYFLGDRETIQLEIVKFCFEQILLNI